MSAKQIDMFCFDENEQFRVWQEEINKKHKNQIKGLFKRYDQLVLKFSLLNDDVLKIKKNLNLLDDVEILDFSLEA